MPQGQHVFGYFSENRVLSTSPPGRFGPATSFSPNALLEIHEDTPAIVRARFEESGVTRLMFQFIEMPIEESMQPQYDAISILGRSEAYLSYAGGSNRTINLNLAFASSVDQRDSGDYSMALQNVRWLQALTLPSYHAGLMYPPPLCRLILGRGILARGVLTSVNPTFEVWSGAEVVFDYPIVCRATVEFTVLNRRPQEARDFLPVTRRSVLSSL